MNADENLKTHVVNAQGYLTYLTTYYFGSLSAKAFDVGLIGVHRRTRQAGIEMNSSAANFSDLI
ncbi:MAG: hypothetical protein Q8K18_02225 [Burkholderiales bacterium]|nr:hypothetical protein [Burkholderiales bacterium]